VVLPFRVSDTAPALWLSNGISKYESGLRLLVSNVIRESPIVTETYARPVVTAITDTTSRTPWVAVTVPPWPQTAPGDHISAEVKNIGREQKLTVVSLTPSRSGAVPGNGSITSWPATFSGSRLVCSDQKRQNCSESSM